MHADVSEAVLAVARWLDAFFGSRRFDAEENVTHVRLRTDTFAEEGEGVGIAFRPRVSLRLPRTERRLRILITGDRANDPVLADGSAASALEQVEGTVDEDASLAAQYFLAASARENVRLSAGARIRDGSPVLFSGARLSRAFPSGPWALRLTERLRWFTDVGFESASAVEVDRLLGDRHLARATTRGFWYEERDGFFYEQGVSLFRWFGGSRLLRLDWNNAFVTRPGHALDEIRLAVAYRQSVWRDWVFVEIAPQIRWPRERDYEATPGILVRLDLVFGADV